MQTIHPDGFHQNLAANRLQNIFNAAVKKFDDIDAAIYFLVTPNKELDYRIPLYYAIEHDAYELNQVLDLLKLE